MAIEDTMAQLAHSQVSQSLPSLANDVQGFQIIESNDENNSAIGVIVALIGNLVDYIPAIYRKGKIYNMDIMYIPELRQWLPTQDNWITYLRSRRAELEASIVDADQAVGKAGSVDLDTPLLKIVKTASESKDIKYLQRVGIPAILKEASEQLVRELTTDVGSYAIPSAIDLLKKCASSMTARKLVNTVAQYPVVADAFVQFYGDDDLVNVASTVVEAQKTIPAEQNKESGTVKILTSASNEAKTLSDQEKATILREGAVIVDTRGYTPTRMFKANHNGSWATPNTTGIYELLRIDGSTITALVIPGMRTPKRNDMTSGTCFVLPLTDNLPHQLVEAPAHILGQICPLREFNITGGYDLNNLPNYRTSYVVVDIDGNALMLDGVDPMYVGNKDEVIIKMAGNMSARVYRPGDSSGFWESPRGYTREPDVTGSITQIVGIPSGGKLRVKGSTLYVPAKCRLFPLVSPCCGVLCDASDTDTDAPKPLIDRLKLATFDEYVDAVSRREKLLSIKVYNDNGKFTISDDTGRFTDPLLKRAAAFDLVEHYAVSPDVATAIIAEQKPNSQSRYLAKIASDTSYHMAFSDKQVSDPSVTTVDLNGVVSEDTRATLERAAQTGVKEIMDVTVLKILAEDGSSIRLIQDLIPSLFTAMNAVGQILFMLRASTSMSDSYGEYRADEMEKQFAKLMQRLGDAVIVLQQGKIDDMKDLLEGPLSSTLG